MRTVGLTEDKPRKRARKTKAELIEDAERTMTNVELDEAVKAAKESPEKPRAGRAKANPED